MIFRVLLGALALLLLAGSAGNARAQVPGLDSLGAVQKRVIPVEQTVPDTLVASQIRKVLAQVEDFRKVNVLVQGGVAHLSGSVPRAQVAEEIVSLVGRFQGVVYVEDGIEAQTAVEDRVSPMIERLNRYVRAVRDYLPLVAIAIIIIVVFVFISRVIGEWDAPRRLFGLNPLAWGLVRRVLRAVIILIGLLLAFDILDITMMVSAGLGAAGILGLALGFAFQDIVENYLAGVLLSIRRPFNVNDLVLIDSHEGRVVRLTSRELILLTLEGNHVRLPNATVFKTVLTNYSRNPKRLFHFDVGIGMGEDLPLALSTGVDTMNAMNGVMEDPPPFARVMELGASSVVVRYHGWVDQSATDYYKVRSEGIRLVKAALDSANIDMPEDIYRVVLSQKVSGDEKAPEGKKEQRDVQSEARNIDVRPDGKWDAQVAEDLARSGGSNLLNQGTDSLAE